MPDLFGMLFFLGLNLARQCLSSDIAGRSGYAGERFVHGAFAGSDRVRNDQILRSLLFLHVGRLGQLGSGAKEMSEDALALGRAAAKLLEPCGQQILMVTSLFGVLCKGGAYFVVISLFGKRAELSFRSYSPPRWRLADSGGLRRCCFQP